MVTYTSKTRWQCAYCQRRWTGQSHACPNCGKGNLPISNPPPDEGDDTDGDGIGFGKRDPDKR